MSTGAPTLLARDFLHLVRHLRVRRRNLDELRSGNGSDSAGSALRQVLLPGGAIHGQTRQQGSLFFRGLITLIRDLVAGVVIGRGVTGEIDGNQDVGYFHVVLFIGRDHDVRSTGREG